jgi:cytochrome c peroxidase
MFFGSGRGSAGLARASPGHAFLQRMQGIAVVALVTAVLAPILPAHPDRACAAEPDAAFNALSATEPISPIPLDVDVDWDKVALGEKLFRDPVLSSDGSLACLTCHQLDRGGDDGLRLSVTNRGDPGVINSLTVFNSALNFRLTWRGRFRTLDEQVESVLRSPSEMNTSWAEILPKLQAEPDYVTAFGRLYADGITRNSVLDAMSNFQRSLVTPNAPFDRYLRGQENALNAEEIQGYQLFKNYGCAACHQGVNVGGNLFQKLGIFKDYFATRGTITEADFGRFLDTGAERDRYVFRVPSLRNVAVTGPYFHDGSVDSLAEAVRKMGEAQLGETLLDAEVGLIVKFLHTLTGEYRGRSLDVD